MKIITVQNEQNITELVQQLFTVPENDAHSISRAAQALFEANPHLEGTTTVRAGTPMVIPDVPGLAAKGGDGAAVGVLNELHTRAREALAYAQSVVDDAGKAAEQEATNSLGVLRSKEFRTLARATNLNVELLTEAVNTAVKDARAQSKTELAGLDALNRALDELVTALGVV